MFTSRLIILKVNQRMNLIMLNQTVNQRLIDPFIGVLLLPLGMSVWSLLVFHHTAQFWSKR